MSVAVSKIQRSHPMHRFQLKRNNVFSLIVLSIASLLVFGPVRADVKIVYPFAGDTVPKTDPAAMNLSSYYVPISFVVICPGGPHKLEWIINNETKGEASFYDQMSVQYIQKLEAGGHHLKVETDNVNCSMDEIKFIVEQ